MPAGAWMDVDALHDPAYALGRLLAVTRRLPRCLPR